MVDKQTTTIPNGELTIESYNYYKREIHGAPVNTVLTEEQSLFLNRFLNNVSNSILDGGIYNQILNDDGECLEILMLSNDLSKKQLTFLHMKLETANKSKFQIDTLRKLLQNETYRIDPSFLIALVLLVKKKCGPNSLVFEGLLADIVNPHFQVKNETLVSIFYGEDPLVKDPVLMSNQKIVLPFLNRLAMKYQNKVK